MLRTHNPAFITSPTFGARHLTRRPRPTTCDCTRLSHTSSRSIPAQIRRPTVICTLQDDTQSNLNRTPNFDIPDDITSTKGFALREAAVYPFQLLDYAAEKFACSGAYAIRDTAGQIAYMGYSKNIASKLIFHARLMPQQCVSFQVYVPPASAELVSPEMLENVLEFWLRENGSIPKGNTVDRALWEQENPVDRKSSNPLAAEQSSPTLDDIPIRERNTPRKVPTRQRTNIGAATGAFDSSFASSSRATAARVRRDAWDSWQADDDDFVEVDVDPLDPFSVSKKRSTTRSSWDSSEIDDDDIEEDWVPIMALAGFAGLLWLFGVLSNALPAATPSLGM